MEIDDSATYVTHLYLMTDSTDLSDALYDLVNDLMNFGWALYTHERGDCFVHLAAASTVKTRLKKLLQRNPWLRAFAFRQPLHPDLDKFWTAHLEFGAYGGHSTKTLGVHPRPNSDESDSHQWMPPKYDSSWLATTPVGSSRAARKEPIGAVATASNGGPLSTRFRLTFHGLPDEVERCLDFATVMLAEHNVAVECDASGNDKYQMVLMSFESPKGPAMRVFNRLVAQVPAATILLEHEDPATGKPRILRAVDGKIDGDHAG